MAGMAPTDLMLDRAIHGDGCAMGELLLTVEEVVKVNNIVNTAGFRFIPAAPIGTSVPARPTGLRSQKHIPTRRTTRQTPSVKELQHVCPPVKAPSPSAKRKASSRRSPSGLLEDSSSEVTWDLTQARKRKKLSTQVITQAEAKRFPSPSPPIHAIPVLNTTPLIKETPRRPPIIELHGTGQGAWEAACSHVSDIMERNPLAKHFLQPVNPVMDGLPEYFDKVQTPMDLQTVRQKLDGNLYTHPFRWQHDIRSIFFNAFVYFEEGSPIWRCAAELAVTFENLCKENLGVNSYAIYKIVTPTPVPVQQVASVSTTEQVREAALDLAPTVIDPLITAETSQLIVAPESTAVNKGPPDAQPAPPDGDVITLQPEQLKALLRQAAETGKTDLSPPTSNIGGPTPSPPKQTMAVIPCPGPLTRAPTSTAALASVLQPSPISVCSLAKNVGRPQGVKLREGMGVVYTVDCIGTPFEQEISRNPPVSALPPPCPVPAAQVADSKSALVLTAAQKKSTLAKFKELDVTYRKAALDLIKNELGIHSLLCALDSRYLPEIEVLPHLKQRQFFLYMKTLVTQQKLAQDAHHLPATLPRILNWGTPIAATEELPTSRKKPLPDRLGASPEVSPWIVSGTARNKASSSSGASSTSSQSDSSDSESESSSASSVYRPQARTQATRSLEPKKQMSTPFPVVSANRNPIRPQGITSSPGPMLYPVSQVPYIHAHPDVHSRDPVGAGKALPGSTPPTLGPVPPVYTASRQHLSPYPIPMATYSASHFAPGGMPLQMGPGGQPSLLSPMHLPPGMPRGLPGAAVSPPLMPPHLNTPQCALGQPPGLQSLNSLPRPMMANLPGPLRATSLTKSTPAATPSPVRLSTAQQDVHRQAQMPGMTPRPRQQRLGFWRPGISGVQVAPTVWSMANATGNKFDTTTQNNFQMNGGTCWGEWKTKVLQETFLSQTRNVGVASERESRAEKADAEI